MESKVKCSCGLQKTVHELVKVNHLWHEDFREIEVERDNLKEKLSLTQSELDACKKQKSDVLELKIELPPLMKLKKPMNDVDDIEALKQQMTVYKEDYYAANNDLISSLQELEKVKHDLQNLSLKNSQLTLQNDDLVKTCNKLNREKLSISKLLNANSHQ